MEFLYFGTFHEVFFFFISAIIIIIFVRFLNSRICPPPEIREELKPHEYYQIHSIQYQKCWSKT